MSSPYFSEHYTFLVDDSGDLGMKGKNISPAPYKFLTIEDAIADGATLAEFVAVLALTLAFEPAFIKETGSEREITPEEFSQIWTKAGGLL